MSEPAERDVVRQPSEGLGGPCDRKGRAIDMRPIQDVLARIVAEWQPLAVWLFGSRARGEANRHSDWDLFVVLPDDAPEEIFQPLVAWRMRKESGAMIDVVPCRITDFRESRGTHNTLSFEVATEGVRLYER